MAVTFFVIGVVLFIAAFIMLDRGRTPGIIWASSTAGCLILASIIQCNTENSPTAMDVYQNKTTLKITYVDGIPIDSVVVFKNRKEK